MNKTTKKEIEQLSKDFASGFDFPLNGSGWLIVDPLACFLDSIGFKNDLLELKANEVHPQVLIIVFQDGTRLVPAGEDLKGLDKSFKNWEWIDKISNGR